MRFLASLTSFSLLIAAPASAALSELSCVFSVMCSPSSTGSECQSANFKLVFSHDTQTGQAFVKGNNGLSEVGLFEGGAGMTFVEVLDSGALQTTTVLYEGAAVHSRNTILGGVILSPSQYRGICEGLG